MANGFIHFLPEQFANVLAWMPSGISVVSHETHGGSVRAEIQGDGIEDGAGYQLIVINEPMRRIIELVKNP